ncbi:MAG TPA: protein-export chaperone SecB [Pseudomonadales bacterium]
MAAATPDFALERIYIKDASFESPRAPEIFREAWQPQFQLDINTRAAVLPDDRFEVILTVTVNAKSATGQTLMIAEVQQAGIFRIRGLPEDRLRRILATQCPGILFPYVRESIDALIVKGGFPALMLAPVNFDAMFDEAVKQQPRKDSGVAPVQH